MYFTMPTQCLCLCLCLNPVLKKLGLAQSIGIADRTDAHEYKAVTIASRHSHKQQWECPAWPYPNLVKHARSPEFRRGSYTVRPMHLLQSMQMDGCLVLLTDRHAVELWSTSGVHVDHGVGHCALHKQTPQGQTKRPVSVQLR